MQDAVCLAQIADGYFGVLDVFGLAAHSAGRPGIYVPLDDGDLPPAEAPDNASKGQMIMVGSRDRARIARAMDEFFAGRPNSWAGVSPANKSVRKNPD